MSTDEPTRLRRADAEHNRGEIVDAARAVIAESGDAASVAEIARRAGVGRATVYRNFATRRELLEEIHAEQIDALCVDLDGAHPGAGTTTLHWLTRVFELVRSNRDIAELLTSSSIKPNPGSPNKTRERVVMSGQPLIATAQHRGQLRPDVTAEQVVDLLIAIAMIDRGGDYVSPLLQIALDGLRPATA